MLVRVLQQGRCETPPCRPEDLWSMRNGSVEVGLRQNRKWDAPVGLRTHRGPHVDSRPLRPQPLLSQGPRRQYEDPARIPYISDWGCSHTSLEMLPIGLHSRIAPWAGGLRQHRPQCSTDWFVFRLTLCTSGCRLLATKGTARRDRMLLPHVSDLEVSTWNVLLSPCWRRAEPLFLGSPGLWWRTILPKPVPTRTNETIVCMSQNCGNKLRMRATVSMDGQLQ